MTPTENTLPAWRSIAVYSDGSGKASDYYDQAIKTIEEREAVHRLQRAFIAKHAETLAGCYWNVGYLEPVIIINFGIYRGKTAKPVDFALLWPLEVWKRVRDGLFKERYHWEAVVDGITIRIQNAEKEEPSPKLKSGAIIRLPLPERYKV